MAESKINPTEFGQLQQKCETNEKNITDLKRTTEREFTEVKRGIEDIRSKTEAIHELSTNMSLMAQGLNVIKEDIKEIKTTGTETSAKVVELEVRDARRLQESVSSIKVAVITAVATCAATAAVGAIISYFF